MQTTNENTADREILLSRLLDAPVELVWEVFTQADHIKNWWGPHGFSNTISRMDVEPGGKWNLVMHGPDGTDYRNESVFREIVKHKRIIFDHVSGPKFVSTIEFEKQGNKTLLRWHMVFETREQFIQAVKTFKADEGATQNIERLMTYLQTQQARKS